MRPACGCLDGSDPGYVAVVDMYAGRCDVVCVRLNADLERFAPDGAKRAAVLPQGPQAEIPDSLDFL